jgi:hypothetical protein
MKNPYLAERHLLPNEVDVNLDMLRTAVLNRVRGHVDRTDIVTEDNSSGAEGLMKLLEKLTRPATLGDGVSDSPVFRLSTRARNSGLPLR